MARRYNARAVKIHRNYSVDEAARALNTSKGTVRRWIKNGLGAITDQKPILIIGSDLIDYLNNRAARRPKCRLHECYCMSCRQPRAPAFGEVEIGSLTPTSGNMRALCEVCSAVMHKRVSRANFDALRAILAVKIVQGPTRINKGTKPCLNEHLHKEPHTHA